MRIGSVWNPLHRLASAFCKECAQKRGTSVLTDPGNDVDAMVQARIRQDVVYRTSSARFGIRRSENQPCDTCMHNRASTTDAGFDGTVRNRIRTFIVAVV